MLKRYKSRGARIVFYSVLIPLVCGLFAFDVLRLKAQYNAIKADDASNSAKYSQMINLITHDYRTLVQKISALENIGVDITDSKVSLEKIKAMLLNGELGSAQILMEQIDQTLVELEAEHAEALAKQEENRKAQEIELSKGAISGKITSDSAALNGVSISLSQGNSSVATAKSNQTGEYTITVVAGTYVLKAVLSGYTAVSKEVTIRAQNTTGFDIAMTKASSSPSASSTSSVSNGHSSYERRTVDTSRGSFTADIMIFDLRYVRVVTDTANQEDCKDNCPTKSLSSYVSENGGFAGIHGTYFCPPDYASCSGKINSFDYKVYNTGLGKMINAGNNLWDNGPFLFVNNGIPSYQPLWKDFGGKPLAAGIECYPSLVVNSAVSVTEAQLDNKQLTGKSYRGALGYQGQTFYAVIVRNATVIDSAYVMQALGVEYALNIDGGGSSAMFFNGGYKVGPGRSLPNAVIFKVN